MLLLFIVSLTGNRVGFIYSNRRPCNFKIAQSHTNRNSHKQIVNRWEVEYFASTVCFWISVDRAWEIDSTQSVRRELGTLEAAYGKLQRETSLMFTRRLFADVRRTWRRGSYYGRYVPLTDKRKVSVRVTLKRSWNLRARKENKIFGMFEALRYRKTLLNQMDKQNDKQRIFRKGKTKIV